MDGKSMDAGLRLLRNRRHLPIAEQELWLYYFMLENPLRGAAKHNVTRAEITELVKTFNANKETKDG